MDPPPDNQIHFDNPRHLLDSTLRFRDDFSDVGSKPDRGDEFLRSTNDVDSSYGCRYHLYDSHSSGSFRNFGFDDSHVSSPRKSRGFGSTVGSFQSFRGFALDNDRIRSNSRDENRRWVGLARPPSRNSSDVCSVDGENEDFDNSHGLQVGLSRRVSNVYDSGKFRGSREGSQEFRQSRKERTSALLRIQSRKSTKRNRNGEQKFPSLCSNDSGPSTVRSRGTVAHTGVRVEQDGEGSPVELDVSFKSNALVAKAIVASPSHGVESNRKLPGQEIDHSNSPLNKLNSSAYGFDCLAISYKESKQSEPSLHHAIESPGKNTMKEPVSDKGVYKVGSVGTSSLRVKKKKVNSHLLRSQAMEKNVDLVEENRSINGPPTASQVGEDGMHSRERSISAGMILVQNVAMQPSPNEVTAFLDHIVGNYTAGSIVLNKGGSDVDPGGSHVHNSNKTRNSSTSPGSSNPLIITVDEGTVIADTSIDLRTISNYATGPAELQNRSTYTGSGQVGDFRHQSCEIEPPVFLQNGFLKGQLEANDSSSLDEIKSHGVPVNLLATVGDLHCDLHNDSSSDNGLIRGQVKIKVSDIDAAGTGSKFNEATVLAGSDYVEGIPRAVPIVESKAIVCLSSAEETSIQEGVSDRYSSNDSATTTSGSDNGLSNSQSKFSFSGIGYLGDTNKESGPVSATVLLENVALGGAPKARMPVGGDLNSGFEKGRPSNERKNSSYPFPSPISSDMSENAFTVLDPVDATLSFPPMDLNSAEKDVLGAGSFSAGSQCCTDEDRILCGYSPIKGSFDNDVSGKGSFRISQKGSFPKYMKKRKISAPVSALPILSLTEEESTNAGTFTSGVELPSLRSMVSNIQQVGSSRFPNCSESYPVLLGNTNPGASFEALGFVGEGFCNNVSELEQKEQSDLVMTIENGFGTEIGGRGKSVEEPGMLQIDNVQQKNPEEIQTLDSDQKLPFTDVECEADLFVKNGFPSVSNTPSLYEHDDGVSTTHLHDAVVESATDKLLNMEATRQLSTVTGSKIVTLGQVSNDKGCLDERNQDENLVPEDLFSLSLSNTSLQNTTTGKKPGHVVGIVSSTTKVGPQDARKTTHGLNSRSGAINKRKDQLASVVPSTFPGHLLKKTAPSSHRTKPRTWHRTANPSTSSHLGKSSYTNPLPPQGQQGKNTGKDQTAAYIRKGNSLVRNPSPVAATSIVSPRLTSSVYRLCPLTVNKMKDKTGLDASLERSKTPPLPCSTKLSNCMTSSPLADPPSNGCSETDSDPLTIRVNADVPKFSDDAPNSTGTSEYRNGQIYDSVSKSVQDDSNSVSRESKKIVYVKRKSNQLVAAPGSSDLSHQNVDKTEDPSSSGYYKRRKNQIIRKSFEVTPKVGLHEELLEGKKALPVIGNSSNRRRSGKGLGKTYKSSKSSLVWTLCGAQSLKKENTLVHQVRPHLFPWKRATYRRSLMHTSASVSTNTSLSTISRKLLLSRKRETIYTRSTQGFSLRKSKVLSVGGASLKWSKSIERKLKKANEEATLAVVAVEKKKREQNGAGAGAVTAGAKNRNRSSRKLVHSIELRPGMRH